MDTRQKLDILADDSKYDLACACGTGKDDHRKRGEDGRWLYPVSLPQGGYSVMLKTLMSNACGNDCKYCPLRSNSNVRRCTLQPDEVAKFFMHYLHNTDVFGLFLSSGVGGKPDSTMTNLVDTARILRKKYRFKGYIHLKVIPGASDAAIEEAMQVASAVSLNIETPGGKYLKQLSDSKNYDRDIIAPLKLMSKLSGKGEKYSRVKCTTQFIVGAADETDTEIVKYMYGIYKRLNFNRIYFSAYQPGLGDRAIPGENRFGLEPEKVFQREHRLYQTDFLVRKYGFDENEIYFGSDGNLDLTKDPKEIWADRHPEFFPVNPNRATREELLRVPGLGPVTVNRIVKFRRIHALRELTGLNVKGKRAEKAARYITWR